MKKAKVDAQCDSEQPTYLVIDPVGFDMDLVIAIMLLAGVRNAGLLEPSGKFVRLI